MQTLSFHVAGLEVELRAINANALADIRGFYRDYPGKGGPADVTINFQYDPTFTPTKPSKFAHPKLTSESIAPNHIRLWRHDLEGQFQWPAGEVGAIQGNFRSLCYGHSLEAAIRIGVSLAIVQRGGLMLHASAVVHEGHAFVFAGVSGAGKSTISSMIGALPGFRKVSDELSLLTPDGSNGWIVHVGPFIGGEGLPHGTHYPVKALHFLRQARHHKRVTIAQAETFRELLRYVVIYGTASTTAHDTLQCAENLTENLPVYQLAFAKNSDVVKVIALT